MQKHHTRNKCLRSSIQLISVFCAVARPLPCADPIKWNHQHIAPDPSTTSSQLQFKHATNLHPGILHLACKHGQPLIRSSNSSSCLCCLHRAHMVDRRLRGQCFAISLSKYRTERLVGSSV